MDGFDRILVPVDWSDPANKAFDRALTLSKSLKGQVTVMHVVRSLGVGVGPIGYEGPILEGQQTPLEEEAVSRRMLADYKKKAESMGVEVRTMLKTGNPSDEIVGMSEDFDLIVMGAHGKHIEHILVGSVADKVIHHACCPVMIVREKRCR